MNKVYKVIWNRTKQCYIVVSEFAKRAGKVKSTHLLAAMGKTTAVVGLGAVLLLGPGLDASAATGKVIGGTSSNQAQGTDATVSGGGDNEAIGKGSSVSGGSQGKATGERSSVTGGLQNQAAGQFSTVSGGTGNKAFGYSSIVIGGTGNVVGKMAVDDKGNPILVDANGKVAKDGNPYPDPNSLFAGTVAVAIGGYSSSVQGGYSVGIAGGSTSELASNSLAAGRQATATVANGVAIGYESTASVIDSSRAADTEGRIVSFGHRAGDIYYTVDYQNHTVTENTYDSDAYNRLVNVADGIDDHDVVVMEQLKNAKAEAVATAKNQIKVKGDETNVHAEETTDQDGVQTTTISLKPKVTLKQDTTTDPTGAKQVVLDGTAGTISAGLSTDQPNYISLNGTTGVAKVGAVEIGNQDFTYDYQSPVSRNDDGTLNLQSNRANAKGTFVTGLSNKTWTPGNYVTGRAATEDQLEQAGRHFLSIKTADKDDKGNPITPVAENTLANYYNDGATGSASMAFGVGTTAQGNLSLAMGVNSSASGMNSLAIGYANTASGTQSVAVGNGTHASGNYSVAMGLGSQAGTQNTDPESTDNGAAVAVGFEASAEQTGSAAYGYMASANNFESSAFGTSATANKDGSVALGAHSVANREKGVKGYLIPDEVNDIIIKEEGDKGNTSADTKIDTAIWMSTDGAVSLGGKTKNAAGQDVTISRQITNLAAGSEDSDAVNVAQLKALASQGMNFQGNDTSTSVHLNQGGTLLLQGSGTKKDEEYSTQNVKVLTDAANQRLSIALDKNPDFDSVTAGTALTDADNGKAGSIKIVGADSKNKNKATTITAGYAASPELAGANGTGRLSYTDGDGTAHTVATLGDGLKLAGDAGKGSVALDNTLTVSGGATNLADGSNIGVTANGSTLSLQLAKDIAGLNTVTAGTVVMGNQTVISDQKKSEPGNFVTGLSNKDWDGTDYVSGRAATEDQLKTVSDSIQKSVGNAQFGITAGGLADGGDVTIKQNLGSAIRIYGDAPVTNEKNDGSGDFWDRSKANILTKVKKDHDGKDYVSVELQDHLEVGTHVGKNTDGTAVAGVDGSMQFKGASAKEVNITGDKGVSLSDGDGNARTVTAALRQDNGTGYLELTGSKGAFTSLFAQNGAQNLISNQDSQSNTRLTYTDKNSKTAHQVATMDDGLVVAGDNGQVTRLLNSTLKLSGGETDTTKLSSGQNIGVVANKDNDGQLDIKLAKDLTDIDSITMTGGLKLNSANGSSTITGLTNKSVDLLDFGKAGRAATEEQLQQVKGSITDAQQGGGFGLSDNAGTVVKQDLGGAIQLKAADSNLTTTADTTGKAITIGLSKTLTDMTSAMFKGASAADEVNITGDTGVTLNYNGSQAAALRQDKGAGYLDLTGTAGTNASVSVHTGAKNLAQQDQTRLTYTDQSGKSHDVATMDDGLIFAGDTGTAVSQALNSTLKISGGVSNATDLSDGKNVGVVASSDGLAIKLAKDLTDIDSITMTGGLKLNSANGSSTITGLSNTSVDLPDFGQAGRAATEEQLQQVKGSITDAQQGGGFGLSDNAGTVVKQDLGGAIQLKAADSNLTTTADTTGKAITIGLSKTLTDMTSAMFKGESAADEVNITGDTGVTLNYNGSQAAALRQDKGAGYLNLTGNTAGTKASVSVHTGARNMAQQDQTRLTYTDQSGKAHDVATLDDGLIFAGDTGTVSRALNSTLKLSGGEKDETKLSSGQNIGVVANKDGFDIKLAKDLTGIESITGLKNTTIGGPDFATQGRAATEEQLKLMQSSITSSITQSVHGGGFGLSSDEKGDDKIVKQDLGKAIQIKGDTTYKADGSVEKEGNIKTSIDNGAIKVGLNKDVDLGNDGSIKAGGVTIDSKGIDADGKNITNVKSGIVNGDDSDNTNAANIGDVHTIVDNKVTAINNNVSDIKNDVDVIKKTGRTYQGDDKKTVKVDFAEGKFLSLTGGANDVSTANNIGVMANGENGLAIRLAKKLNGLESVTTGKTTMDDNGLTIAGSDGKAGTTVTGSGIKIASGGDGTHAVEVSNSNVSMGGQQIHDVAPGTAATDAVNVSQLSMFADNVGGAINKLDNRVNRVGAGAAALAALHPLDFDPDDKWDFAAGFGNYKNANAAAIGAYYRPNEDTMFSVGGSFGGGENMVNAGVSFKLGQGNHVSTSRTMMAKEIESLKAVVKEQNEKLQENENLRAKVDKQDKEIAELKAMVQQLAARR